VTSFRIAFFGDVVGAPGIRLLKRELRNLIHDEGIDFVVVNGENVAQGAGTTRETTQELFKAGVDVITNGDHVYRRRRDFVEIKDDPRILRPANLPPDAAGHGTTVVESQDGTLVGVLNLIGRVFMDPVDCPFRAADPLVEELADQTPIILVDFHAEASSEKMAMGWHLDGRVSAVVGTHTHTPTADQQILEAGTAFVSDLGMVGAYHSVIGRVKERVLYRFLTGMPTPFNLAEKGVRGHGMLVVLDPDTGQATEVKPLMLGEPPRLRSRPKRQR
jgi:metallophosphoesterase (TIGR00282 family)